MAAAIQTTPTPSLYERALAAEQAKQLTVLVSRRVLVIRKRAI